MAILLSITTPLAIPKHSTINSEELHCLAEVIYREARGESYTGQLAVGQVVINRVRNINYPGTICKVVFQKGQFPWTKTFSNYTFSTYFIEIANTIIHGEHELKNFKATHFHATYVKPNWNLTKIAIIGNHIFYKS